MPENEKETDKAVSNSDINAECAYTSRLVEQARIELASYRIAKRLSTRLCRSCLTMRPSATEETHRQKSKCRRPADFKAKQPSPASNDARSLPTGKRCGRTA